MTINGWNIEEAGGRQFKVTFGYHAVTTRSEWPPGARLPILAENSLGFKPLQIVVVVKESGREMIRTSISTILAHLTEPVEIVLDGMDHIFRGYLKKHTVQEMSKKRWHVLTLDLEGCEYGEPVASSGTGSIEVWNRGTMPAQAVLKLTPPAGLSQLIVTGMDDEVTLTGIQSGEEIVIDSENGLVTQGGSILETDFTRFPELPVGVVNLSCSNTLTGIQIEFRPRFM